MIQKTKFWLLTFTFMLINYVVLAQTNVPDDGSLMKSNGKIYVVMAVVIVIVLGLFIYLIALDRKLRRIEKDK
jgi:uncharacterized membrane protein YhaH (DUF805 family)